MHVARGHVSLPGQAKIRRANLRVITEHVDDLPRWPGGRISGELALPDPCGKPQ